MGSLPFDRTAIVRSLGGEPIGDPVPCSPAFPAGQRVTRTARAHDHRCQLGPEAEPLLREGGNLEVLIPDAADGDPAEDDGVTAYRVVDWRPYPLVLAHVACELTRQGG